MCAGSLAATLGASQFLQCRINLPSATTIHDSFYLYVQDAAATQSRLVAEKGYWAGIYLRYVICSLLL